MFRKDLKERKDYIAKKAAQVFVVKGYKTASLEDVAKRVKISKAGIYHYFKKKDEILYYIIGGGTERFLEVLNDCIAECEEKKLDSEASFRKLIVSYARFINSERELRLLVLRERHQLTGKYEQGLYEMEQQIFHTLRDQLRKIIVINDKYDLNVISFLVIAFSHWIGYWVSENGELSQDEIIRQSTDILFNGFLGESN